MLRILATFFPFLKWFKNYNFSILRIDFISGLTVALVLIPQSMAYAQLAGLPAYYGLYAAFLPPLIAALFGSSNQLATGPVAVVSLMTATALEPLAVAGSEAYIAYAILLAIMVGLFQFVLGSLRLGLVVNFLSHPVVNGFTNAAAIIIATSQLSKLFGVYVDKAEHHYETVYNVIKASLVYTHWPTLAIAVLAFLIMIGLKRLNPKLPGVLIAVIVTTLISWSTGYENNYKAGIAEFDNPVVREKIQNFNEHLKNIDIISQKRTAINAKIIEIGKHSSHSISNDTEDNENTEIFSLPSIEILKLKQQVEILNVEMESLKEKIIDDHIIIRSYRFEDVVGDNGTLYFFTKGQLPSNMETEGHIWQIKIGNKPIDETSILLIGGGAVVANIPQGLPGLKLPSLDFSDMLVLFPMSIIISLLGFMEAISIAKAMAAKTGQRLDPNQELIGQGLANIIGSMGQSYAVSGSFSRSAVNLQAGAKTGLSNVFSSCIVAITLLLFTPLLYYLPQAVLAAIIMMAVIGLVNVRGFIHAWKAQKYDGAISIITFVSTLAFAPHLDRGIMIGVFLSLVLYLLRVMKPKIALLSKYTDGTFRDSDRLNLKRCKHIAVVRYSGSIFFTNVKYLEDKILEQMETMPELKHILIVGNAINELDASGEEMLSLLVDRIHNGGYDISFSGLNDSVLDVMRRTYLYEKIGEDHLYRNATRAIESLYKETHRGSNERECPLIDVYFTD